MIITAIVSQKLIPYELTCDRSVMGQAIFKGIDKAD